jgi:hypothetical protein
MLIDTREPPPLPQPPQPPPWEPNWHMWAWIGLAGLSFGGATLTSGFLPFLLGCAAMFSACRAATVALDYGDGLREHRQ